jgi:hypothetical protein
MHTDRTLENLHKLQILRRQGIILNDGRNEALQKHVAKHPKEPLTLACLFIAFEPELRRIRWMGAGARALLRQTPALALIKEDEL